MTNEELALDYQRGGNSLPALWDEVRIYVHRYAYRFSLSLPPERGITLEDLKQTGFIAAEAAARTFDPEGGANFLTWLTYHLRKEFMAAAGYDRRHPDPLNDRDTVRLDAPFDADDADGDTIGDTIPDARIDVDAVVVDEIYQTQLRDALDAALNDLPPMEREVVTRKYYRAEGRAEIAAALGLPDAATVTRREQSGLDHLGRGAHGRTLEVFLYDETDPYHGVSYTAYAQSGASSVENTVLRREKLWREWNKAVAGLG